MSRKLIKIHIVLAQISTFVFFFEFLFLQSIYSFVLAGILILSLGRYKCQNCKTPVWDERIMGRYLPVKPSVVDDCAVCGQPFVYRESDDK